MSKEYSAAIVLLFGAGLKFFGFELDNGAVEAIVTALLAIVIAVSRYAKGDITLAGTRLRD